MKKILVPCDFSPTSINAFRFALDVAAQSKGAIHLLHAIELPVLHDTLLMPTLYFEKAYLEDVNKNTQKRFEKLIAKYKTGQVKVTSRVMFGMPSKMVQDYVSDEGIDIVIMGSHGASGIREFLIGSNAAKIVRTSTVPVLVIKERVKNPIKRIVLPNSIDPEKEVDLIMRIKALQSFFKAQLHLVWINTPLNFTLDTITRMKLNDMVKQFDLKNCTLDIFNYSDIDSGILAYTEMVKGDFIAMGTHGRSGIAHLITGSIAEAVVNHGSIPVWTFVTKEG